MAVAEPILGNDQDTGQSELAQRLARTWRQPKGLWGWFCNTHHTDIGIRFMVTAFIFFLLGGVLAAMIRLQLIRPENSLMGPDLYNQIFTMHGSTMIFLFAVPMMFQGFGVYIVPLMCGARNIAFPRLNAFSYYLYVGGALVLWGGLLTNTGPDVGWFAYVPLSGPAYSPGHRADIWSQMITFTEVSALGVAICIATTILRHRAPGMTLNRMPILLWEKLVISIAVIFAMPAVMIASGLLLLDRLVGTHFFNPAEGGDVLLYQHLFWFFGHPEVYIIFLPGAAIVSTVVECFSRRRIVGYTPIVVSVVATGFLGFSVWVHHMFATGLPQLSESFFTAASLMIVIPTGTQFFCWVATLWYGRLQLRLPMLWCFGFFFVFLIGGLSGVMLASVPVDLQVHDTYFVVAHFHYVLIGGALFPMFAGIYFWFPKMTGRIADSKLGKWHFWLFFIGFNITFFTLHFLGLRGMPRRVYTYGPDMHWQGLNLLASSGVIFMTAGLLVFLANVFRSVRAGEIAGNNPWGDAGLEWSMSSPPPPYNFLHIPTVSGRDPLWEDPPDQPLVVGLRDDIRETLVTHSLDADPQHKDEDPGPSIWPFLTAVTVSAAFVGSIFTPLAVPIGAPPVIRHANRMALAARAISYPSANRSVMASLNEPIRNQPIRSRLTLDVSALPSVAFGHRNTTWLANIFYMAIEGMMFALMFATYFYLRTRSMDWPPGHLPPALKYGMANAVVLLLSIIPAWLIRRRTPELNRRAVRNGLLTLTLFALLATILRVFEFSALNCRWTDDAYSSTVWVLIGMHTGHLLTELIETAVLLVISFTPKMEGTRLADAAINSDYWYFVVVTGLIVDLLIYGTTRFL